MATPGDLWHVRKQMTTQFASFIFTTYIFSVGMRTPGRMSFSRSSGNLYTTDLLPSTYLVFYQYDITADAKSTTGFKPNKAEFGHSESVPFRFTPNLQKFFGAIGTEGVLSSSLLAISRALTEIEVSSFPSRLTVAEPGIDRTIWNIDLACSYGKRWSPGTSFNESQQLSQLCAKVPSTM